MSTSVGVLCPHLLSSVTWGKSFSENQPKNGNDYNCLPSLRTGFKNQIFMAMCSKAQRTIQICYSMLGRTLWGTWFHQYLISVIAPSRKWSWEKGIRRGLSSSTSVGLHCLFPFMCQFDLVCFSDVLSWALLWVSAFTACEVSLTQKLFGDYHISELVSTIGIIHSNLLLFLFKFFSL